MAFDGIAGLANSVLGFFFDSPEVKAVKESGRIELAKLKIEQDKMIVIQRGEWENTMAGASNSSWKDEAALYTWLGIMIACFLPYTQPYVREGFVMLNTLPEWWSNLLYLMVAASFGIKLPGAISKVKRLTKHE